MKISRMFRFTIRLGLLAVLVVAISSCAPASAGYVQDDPLTSPRTEWWREAKFGMFIHWGVYAIPARGEWVMHSEKIPIAEYEKFPPEFNPVQFDAKAWARLARKAGMKYMVITSKHHDGFSMFDTKVNDYNIVRGTPYKSDPMAELAAACKAEGVRFAFYYSIMDWHHPDANEEGRERYVPQMKEQLRELVDQYDPAILWFDGDWPKWWTAEMGDDLEAYVRDLKPDIILNNRVGKRTGEDGDFGTPEQHIPGKAMKARLWETCMTLNNNWGYHAKDHNWKSPRDVVHKLADIVSKGGNFLLNVGPDEKGLIPQPSVDILENVGEWMEANGEAIYGTEHTTIPTPRWGRITRKGDKLYLIVFDWPDAGKPLLAGVTNRVKRARILDRTGKVTCETLDGGGGLRVHVPQIEPDPRATVVELILDGAPQVVASPEDWRIMAYDLAVSPGENGALTMRARDAMTHGGVRLERKGDGENLGYWVKREDWCEWIVKTDAAGSYDVTLTYACADGAGGTFALQSGDATLAGEASPTGGWDAFTTVDLGSIDVPAGISRLSVKPAGDVFNGALMNLMEIKLTPKK